jgi:hypothetical protein
LILLHAFRDAFPDALFFTTDLDARLLQFKELPYTRNLLIASHFGLSLQNDVQGGVSPFRGCYQTADYFGLLHTLNFGPLKNLEDKVLRRSDLEHRNYFPAPRIYEVGRSGAYDFAVDGSPSLHADGTRGRFPLDVFQGLLLFVGVLLVLVTILFLSAPLQQLMGARDVANTFPNKGNSKKDESGQPRADVTALQAPILYCIVQSHGAPDQEPFELFEGLSIWPSVVIRFGAGWLAWAFFSVSYARLKRRSCEFRETWHVRQGTPFVPPQTWVKSLLCSLNAYFMTPEALSFQDMSQTSKSENEREPYGLEKLWNTFYYRYMFECNDGRRLFLCAAYVMILLVFLAVFPTSNVNARGAFARWTDLCVFVFMFFWIFQLIVHVVDCTYLTYHFVRSSKRACDASKDGVLFWPKEKLDSTKTELGFANSRTNGKAEREYADGAAHNYLLIRLIDACTVDVSNLVYSPFIVLLVLYASHNAYFDNWNWSVPFAVCIGLSGASAVSCATQLQRASKNAKTEALERIDKLILEYPVGASVKVHEKLREVRIASEKTTSAAFADWYENPVIRALLIPALGGSGLAALQFFLTSL